MEQSGRKSGVKRAGWACAALVLGIALGGCVTTPLTQRDWVELQTPHYDLVSALGEEETARLARDVERFRAAAEFLWERALPTEPTRTRIYAFYDKGLERLFRRSGNRASYLLPGQRGDVIVLRGGEGWSGDADTELKLEYARRLLWNAIPEALPPWYEEGLPQLASTLQIRTEGADIGVLRDDHVRRLLGQQWIPLERLLGAEDLLDWSSREREMLEAESWALSHYLRFSGGERSSEAMQRYLRFLENGASAEVAARSALGEDFHREVWHHVNAREIDSVALRIRSVTPAGPGRALSRPEILEHLGELSLAIGRSGQAQRYFERALAAGHESARLRIGLGAALLAEGEPESAEAHYHSALAQAPDDATVHTERAHVLRRRAARAGSEAQRRELLERAREHYRRGLPLPEAELGLAESYLVPGEDAAQGRPHLERARRALPGDARIRQVGARIALAAGDPLSARGEALHLLSRARGRLAVRNAQALLAEIDARLAAN